MFEIPIVIKSRFFFLVTVAVPVLVRKYAFTVGDKVVAAIQVLADRGRDLDQISVAIDQD